MTGELFKQWLRKLDRKYELKDQRIQLIVDDCWAHKVGTDLKAIKLAFLPPNMTIAVLQPTDQRFIKNIRSF